MCALSVMEVYVDDYYRTFRERVIGPLRANSPERKDISIELWSFQTEPQVAELVQALRANEYATGFILNFMMDNNLNENLNWGLVFREIAARQNLKNIKFASTPRGRFLPLLRDCFFLPRINSTTSSLWLLTFHNFCFYNDMEDIVSCLDGAAMDLTNLSFENCFVENATASTMLTAALQRNSRLQSFALSRGGSDLMCPILESLASSNSASRLKRLICFLPSSGHQENKLRVEALQQYLESPSATIQCLVLGYVTFDRHSGPMNKVWDGLSRNTSVNELVLKNCWLGQRRFRGMLGGEHAHEQEDAQQFATLLRSKADLAILCLAGECNFFNFPIVVDAVRELLVRRGSPLRCLDAEILIGTYYTIPLDAFQTLLTASSKSVSLKRLRIRAIRTDVNSGYFDALLNAIPSLKVKDLCVTVLDESGEVEQEARLLEALKNNYSIQRCQCLRTSRVGNDSRPLFNNTNRARLEFYLHRNHKLAHWTKHPELVPRDLWTYAVNLALKAGINTLFESLMALSGQGVGLQDQHAAQKRKRRADHNVSQP